MKPVARKYIPEEFLFDKRLLGHNLSQGIITPQELQEHLNQLPDLSDEVAYLEPPAEDNGKSEN